MGTLTRNERKGPATSETVVTLGLVAGLDIDLTGVAERAAEQALVVGQR